MGAAVNNSQRLFSLTPARVLPAQDNCKHEFGSFLNRQFAEPLPYTRTVRAGRKFVAALGDRNGVLAGFPFAMQDHFGRFLH